MYNTKLITLLRGLSKEELKAFTKYLTALYGGKKTSIDLFQHIKKYADTNYEHKRLAKEYIQTKVLQVDKEQRVSNEASKIYEWLNEFLIINRLKRDEHKIRYQQLLLEEYRARGIEKLVDLTLPSIEKELKKATKKPSDYLYEIEMYHEAYFNRLNEINPTNSIIFDKGYNSISQGLKLYQLKYACEAMTRRNMLNIPLPEIEFIKVATTSTLGQVYELLYGMFLDENVASFLEAKSFFESNFEEIPNQDQRFIIGAIINWGAKYMRKGKSDLNETLLKLYLFGLDKKILLKGGFIPDMMFSNMIALIIPVKNFELAKKIVSDYGSYLSPKDKEVGIRLANAQIYLAEGNLNEAKELLEYKYDDILHELKNRTLCICCLYLLDEDYTIIDNKCNAFLQFINRKEIFNKTYRDSVKNFVRIVKKLINKTESPLRIKEDLDTANPIIAKTWLTEQIKDYKALYA